jgi:hypothetical protein
MTEQDGRELCLPVFNIIISKDNDEESDLKENEQVDLKWPFLWVEDCEKEYQTSLNGFEWELRSWFRCIKLDVNLCTLSCCMKSGMIRSHNYHLKGMGIIK